MKIRNSFRSKIILLGILFLFVVLLITSFFGKKGLLEIQKAKKNEKVLLEEKERLMMEKSRLEKEINELEKNPQAVEKEAREKLWLLKPDEKVIIFRETKK